MKNLNAAEVKQVAKELKIKNWWNKKRADLVTEIAEVKGWSHETPEIIEFLLAGGEIKQCPASEFPLPKPEKETSAMVAQDKPEKKKPRRRPAKKAKATTEKSRQPQEGMTTLADICKELGVEGRIARRKLRTAKFEQPGATWAWEEGSKEIDEVKELLK